MNVAREPPTVQQITNIRRSLILILQHHQIFQHGRRLRHRLVGKHQCRQSSILLTIIQAQVMGWDLSRRQCSQCTTTLLSYLSSRLIPPGPKIGTTGVGGTVALENTNRSKRIPAGMAKGGEIILLLLEWAGRQRRCFLFSVKLPLSSRGFGSIPLVESGQCANIHKLPLSSLKWIPYFDFSKICRFY